jgi:hypothetical protein
MSGPHDLGGTKVDAPVPRRQHAILPWEMRVDALMQLLSDPTRPGGPLMSVDELRRGIESLSPELYRSLGYYERWLHSLIVIMSEKGVIERSELENRLADVELAHEREHAERGER